jgi:beta-glucosidase-like glycosyl hydrolase
MARIDDAVKRILRVKFAMGLMDKSKSVLADRSLWKNFGTANYHALQVAMNRRAAKDLQVGVVYSFSGSNLGAST